MHLPLQLRILGDDRDLSLEVLFNRSESEIRRSDEGGRRMGLAWKIMPDAFRVESPTWPLIFEHLDPVGFLENNFKNLVLKS